VGDAPICEEGALALAADRNSLPMAESNYATFEQDIPRNNTLLIDMVGVKAHASDPAVRRVATQGFLRDCLAAGWPSTPEDQQLLSFA
jgi:hypothetical protein